MLSDVSISTLLMMMYSWALSGWVVLKSSANSLVWFLCFKFCICSSDRRNFIYCSVLCLIAIDSTSLLVSSISFGSANTAAEVC